MPDMPGIDTSKMKQSNRPGDGGFECRHAAFAFFNLKAQPAEVLGQKKSHVGIVICDQKTFTGVLCVWCRLLCQMSDPVGGDLITPADIAAEL